jgi:PAS domain S-box-containing protein
VHPRHDGSDDSFGDFTPASAMAIQSARMEQSGSIHRVQVAQCVRAIPLLLLFHAAAALSIHTLGGLAIAGGLLAAWHGMVVGVAAGFAAVFLVWRAGRMHQKPDTVLRLLELLCLCLGLVWALPAAAAIYAKSPVAVFPVAGITLAVLGIAAMTLIRVPTGLTVFVALVTATLARALFIASEQYGAMAALVCVIYGLVLIAAALNSHFDFLRRSRAEIEVHRQNDVIRLLLNDFEREALDWLWETDAEGRLTHVSRRLAELTGLSEAALRLRSWRHVLADFCTAEDWRTLDVAMAQEDSITNHHLDMMIQGRALCWQITARPIRDRQGRFCGYRGVCRDVTALREAERRSHAAMDACENANAAKSRFLAIMSHELRTPINSIVGFAELLAHDRDGSIAASTRREFSNTILQSARHLQAMISDLLDATRMERGTLTLNEQELDAAEIVEVAIKLSRDHAEQAGVSIVARLVDGVTVTGDATRLRQVITNLLVNAVKFSPAHGIVHVDMQRSNTGQLIVAIRDAGMGIAPADMERVFDAFVQVDGGLARRHGGVGLGLSIARRIARLHDGDVMLDSVAGAGTTARLVLPARRVIWPAAAADTTQNVA